MPLLQSSYNNKATNVTGFKRRVQRLSKKTSSVTCVHDFSLQVSRVPTAFLAMKVHSRQYWCTTSALSHTLYFNTMSSSHLDKDLQTKAITTRKASYSVTLVAQLRFKDGNKQN
eukprot:scpid111015/ scgid26473/ 